MLFEPCLVVAEQWSQEATIAPYAYGILLRVNVDGSSTAIRKRSTVFYLIYRVIRPIQGQWTVLYVSGACAPENACINLRVIHLLSACLVYPLQHLSVPTLIQRSVSGIPTQVNCDAPSPLIRVLSHVSNTMSSRSSVDPMAR